MAGFDGEVEWDTSKPDGQMRRRLNVSRAGEYFHWEATTDLENGLKETVAWYEDNRDRIGS